MPKISMVVLRWLIEDRPPYSNLYTGAILGVVAEGPPGSRLLGFWHMDGPAYSDVFVVDASGFTSYSPKLVTDSYDWSFSATLVVPYQMKNAKLKVAAITDEILLNSWIRIVSDHATPYVLADELPSGNGSLLLGNLEEGTYSFTVSGDQGKSGTAMLRVGIYSDNFDVLTLADTKFLGS